MTTGRRTALQPPAVPASSETTVRTRPTYRGRGGNTLKTIYDADHVESRGSGRFRWLFSTCLAAMVGAIAIVVVIHGSSDRVDGSDGLLPALRQISEGSIPPQVIPAAREIPGLKWAVAKTDRLQLTTGALSTRYIIHETQKQRRAGREYIHAKPYARIVARLAAVPSDATEEIPPFNPFKLYANARPVSATEDPDENAGSGLSKTDVSVKFVELLGGILPGEDGQELDDREVAELVDRSRASDIGIEGNGAPLDAIIDEVTAINTPERTVSAPQRRETSTANTTTIKKARSDDEDAGEELEGGEVAVVKVGAADSLVKILSKAGADSWQARSMVDAARAVFPESALQAGQEVRMTLVTSLTQANRKEPSRFSVFSDGHEHLITVSRNAAGEFVASTNAQIDKELSLNLGGDGEGSPSSSLYASLYHAGLVQNVPSDTILQIMRIHAFETDFRRRIRSGDTVEMFFDMKEDRGTDGPPGELLFTSIASGGETFGFYRFRSADGIVDYYDRDGNNSKKFLMRRPVRGDDVRLTSGFGIRFHPLLNERKMHSGVDWACAPGTPILAAGNGVIEEAGRKGQYGNYLRIRHANGYQTAYGHMQRIAAGAAEGVKVRQGQVIGYVGSTGLSSGPHLHFEVLVNTRFVDPMSIEVPRERKLEGADLADFHKERNRVDELMRRSPVMTASK